jgi:hypothetical protein
MALEGGEWSAACPGHTLPPGKTWYPLYRRLGGPQSRSGRAENLAPPGFNPRTVQPIVSRYTDWATRPMCKYNHKNTNIIHVQAHGTCNKHFCFEGVHSKHSICQCQCRTIATLYRAPLSMQTLSHTRSELTLIPKTVIILFKLKEGGNYTSEIFITHRVILMNVVINLQYHSLKMI